MTQQRENTVWYGVVGVIAILVTVAFTLWYGGRHKAAIPPPVITRSVLQ